MCTRSACKGRSSPASINQFALAYQPDWVSGRGKGLPDSRKAGVRSVRKHILGVGGAGIFSESICGSRYLSPRQHAVDEPRRICHRSAMDQHRDLAMSKDLDRLAAEDNRGNAVAAMRSHDD